MAKLTKAEKQARWVAQPIARVESPLKFLASRLNHYEGEGDERRLVIDPRYTVARRHARKGNGTTATKLALLYANQ